MLVHRWSDVLDGALIAYAEEQIVSLQARLTLLLHCDIAFAPALALLPTKSCSWKCWQWVATNCVLCRPPSILTFRTYT